jgi:hypothetical protein
VLANRHSNYTEGTKFDLPLTCFSNLIYNILFKSVKEEVSGVRPLSFVDDTSFTARGNSVRELCEKLQKASEAAIDWGCCQNRGTPRADTEGAKL